MVRSTGSNSKIRRGVSRHNYFQRELMKKRIYVKSLKNRLTQLGIKYDSDSVIMFIEVPFNGHKEKKKSRADAVIYDKATRQLIIVEYKTTEQNPQLKNKCYQNYLTQIDRTSRNFEQTINMASKSSIYQLGDCGKKVKLINLLVLRNYHVEGTFSDVTTQIGCAIEIPNIRYSLLLKRLKTGTLCSANQ